MASPATPNAPTPANADQAFYGSVISDAARRVGNNIASTRFPVVPKTSDRGDIRLNRLANFNASAWGVPSDRDLFAFSEAWQNTLVATAGATATHIIQAYDWLTIVGIRVVVEDATNHTFAALQGCTLSTTWENPANGSPLGAGEGIDASLFAGSPEHPFVPFGPVIQRDKAGAASPNWILKRIVAGAATQQAHLFCLAFRNDRG